MRCDRTSTRGRERARWTVGEDDGERSRRPEKVASAARRDARAREDATASARDDRTIEAKTTDARVNVR